MFNICNHTLLSLCLHFKTIEEVTRALYVMLLGLFQGSFPRAHDQENNNSTIVRVEVRVKYFPTTKKLFGLHTSVLKLTKEH